MEREAIEERSLQAAIVSLWPWLGKDGLLGELARQNETKQIKVECKTEHLFPAPHSGTTCLTCCLAAITHTPLTGWRDKYSQATERWAKRWRTE